jgi:aminoglycoside phosphotransferase (APT) family kinase protein
MLPLVPIVNLAAHLGRGVQRIATDAVVGTIRKLPRQVADVDAVYLAELMDAHVRSVEVVGGDAGTSSRALLKLTGTGVPETVFLKMAAETAATRLMGELGRLGRTEVQFYRDLAPQVSDVPRCYGSAFDALTGRFVLVLEDLAAGGPCEFPDTLHPLSVDQAALIVELLARLHATFWGKAGNYPWVYSASGDATSLLTGSLANTSVKKLQGRTDIPIENGRFIIENYRAAATLIDRSPTTVMHGDAHPGNVYFRNGKAGLLDWQAVRKGHPGRELSYTLVTSMTIEDRRTHQRDLLDTYRRALAAAGGPELDRDGLWDRFRQGATYAYVATLITSGMGGMQDDTIAMEGLARSVAALEDLDTVAQLKRHL